MPVVLHTITTLGSSAVILPVAALLFLWLALAQSPRAAAQWTAAFAMCGLCTVALKLRFIACPDTPLQLRSSSGHAAIATFFYGGLALVLGGQQEGWRRMALMVGAPVLIALVAASRIALHAHSPVEAVIGTAVGLATISLFGALYRPVAPQRRLPWLLPLALVMLPLSWGRSFPMEAAVDWVALRLHDSLGVCV